MLIGLNWEPGRKNRRSLTNYRRFGPAPDATPSVTVIVTERRHDSFAVCNNQRHSRLGIVTSIHERNTQITAADSESVSEKKKENTKWHSVEYT